MSAPRAGDKCCIHMLHFAKIDEVPGEDPDLEELLSEFAAHKCQRSAMIIAGRLFELQP